MPPSSDGHRRFSRPDDELRRLDALARLGLETAGTTSEDELLGAALTTIGGGVPAHAVAIAVSHEGDVRISERLIRGRMPVETATLVAALALDRHEPVERKEGDSTVLGFPLSGSRGPLGAIVATSYKNGIGEPERAMLQAAATQLSLAVDNLRLRRQLERLLFRTMR